MSVVPTGLPAWQHANDHTTYGGNVNKENYQGQDSVNGKTDVSAQELVRIAADLAAIQRTAAFCTMNFTCNDSSPAIPTINSYESMAGAAPTPTRNGNGDVGFAWAASYTDPYSVPGNINIVGCTLTVEGSSAEFPVYDLFDVDVNGLNEFVRVKIFDDAGAAVLDATVTLRVYTGQV